MNVSSKITLVISLLLMMNVIFGSEMVMNDNGEITKIDDVVIDFRIVGVLKYDYKVSDDEKDSYQRGLDALVPNGDKKVRYVISGAKRINDCIVISCGMSNNGLMVADGGIDVVYSRVSQKILGQYCGGFRG